MRRMTLNYRENGHKNNLSSQLDKSFFFLNGIVTFLIHTEISLPLSQTFKKWIPEVCNIVIKFVKRVGEWKSQKLEFYCE